MESARKGDDAGAAGGGAGDLDGVLDGFGAGGQEDGLLVAGDRSQIIHALGQGDVVLVGSDLHADMGEGVELGLGGGDDLGVAMAGAADGDAAGEIDVALAFSVPDFRVLGLDGEDRQHGRNATGNGGNATGLKGGIAIGHDETVSRFCSHRPLARFYGRGGWVLVRRGPFPVTSRH